VRPYYEDGLVVLFHADAREVVSWLPTVDHVITDPPYAPETHDGARGGAGDSHLVTFEPVTASELRELYASLDARRWLVATMDWHHVSELEQSPPDGWVFIRFGIWVKPDGLR
jgi:hypothetical protein